MVQQKLSREVAQTIFDEKDSEMNEEEKNSEHDQNINNNHKFKHGSKQTLKKFSPKLEEIEEEGKYNPSFVSSDMPCSNSHLIVFTDPMILESQRRQEVTRYV